MTTIAMRKIKGAVQIASDSLSSSSDGTTGRTDKVLEVAPGTWLGLSGEGRRLQQMQRKGVRTPEEVADFLDKHDENHAIMLHKGNIYDITPGLVELAPRKYLAIGSGAAYATAAMHLGLDVYEAVRVAKKFDLYTGGKIKAWEVLL